MYEVLEISLANVRRLYDYHLRNLFEANFNLKGFAYPWLISSHTWKKGEKVLDVGAAYSPMPIHLQQTYGCEVWCADDFGLISAEPFWQRNQSPSEYIAAHPEIKFVLERLGDQEKSSLPAGTFDTIYSVSTLEHVPYEPTPAVWQHMDTLLKPGGEMLHTIDLPFPSNFGLKGLLKVFILELFFPILPRSMKIKHFIVSPKTYRNIALRAIHVRYKTSKELSILNMALNPDILQENYIQGLFRIMKDKMENYPYLRKGSLLIRLKKGLE
jgi:SAM-dependent methyltransferase